ncbi:C39 family peptidase [Nonomuraea sp. B12E4]|uniref:C39 family peptidase n=1 Tax=Nonomuraea sp. B12E4 TaxID=3153564 RepID=UPI00325EFD1E
MKKWNTGTGIALAVTAGVLQFAAPGPAYASPGVASPVPGVAPSPAPSPRPSTTASPSPSPIAAPAPSASTKGLLTPLKYQLSLTGQQQQTNYYCVPASSSMSLSTFGIKVSQATLAKKMKTTASDGTSGTNALPVLNAYIKSKGYRFTKPTDSDGNPSMLMKRVSENIGDLHRAPVIAVWMEQLPWNQGKVKGANIGHAIVAYGYDKPAGTVTVYDPWKPTGGIHTISATALAGIVQPKGNMYYVSKL